MTIRLHNKLWCETDETASARHEQAQRLKDQAQKHGLRFESYLPPDLAVWVLEQVERGEFVDPSELVFVMMQQARDIASNAMLRSQIFTSRIEKGLAAAREDRPSCTWRDAKKRIAVSREVMGEPARWIKIDNRDPDVTE